MRSALIARIHYVSEKRTPPLALQLAAATPFLPARWTPSADLLQQEAGAQGRSRLATVLGMETLPDRLLQWFGIEELAGS